MLRIFFFLFPFPYLGLSLFLNLRNLLNCYFFLSLGQGFMNISNFFPTPAQPPVIPPVQYTAPAQSNFIPVSGSAVVPSGDLSSLLLQQKLQLSAGSGQLSHEAVVTQLSPGNIQALSPALYFSILNNILLDIASRYQLVIDPTKLTYKMIKGLDTPLNVQSVGVEISTMTTSDQFRFRFYFLFETTTSFRFVNRLQEQNYGSTDPAKSTIYLYSGTVDKNTYFSDYAATFSPSFQNNIPQQTSSLLTESGTPLIYLSEDHIPISLEF